MTLRLPILTDETPRCHTPGEFTAAHRRPPAIPLFIQLGSMSGRVDHKSANVKLRRGVSLERFPI
jgi:hypothetical protein